MSKKSKFRFSIITCLLVIIIAAAYIGYEAAVKEVEIFSVSRGNFIIDVLAEGELKAVRSVNVSLGKRLGNVLELKIVDLVPEGSFVQEGDFLVKFDTAEIEKQLDDEIIKLDTKHQELDVLLAKQKTGVVKRENQLKRNEMEYEIKKITFEASKFEPENKRKRDEIDMQKSDLEMLNKKDEIEIEKFNDATELKKKQDEIDRLEKTINDLKEQIIGATLYASIPGLVIYKEVFGRSTGIREKVRIGSEGIYYRDPVIELPDLSQMKVTVMVNEKEINNIRKGNEVIISVETDGKIFYGNVTRVGTLAKKEYYDPSDRSKFRSLYPVDIDIESDHESINGIMPGIVVKCRIITERIENVLFVPYVSVYNEEGQNFVYLQSGNGYEKQPVVLGQENKGYIVIQDGLIEGQMVTLLDPYLKLETFGENEGRELSKRPKAPSQGVISQPMIMESSGGIVIIRQ
ncbi:efflux RND transporter periplasmic adaptor subunit [candidate division KSB1 bacterium]